MNASVSNIYIAKFVFDKLADIAGSVLQPGFFYAKGILRNYIRKQDPRFDT